MQPTSILDIAYISAPSLIVGMILGYVFGDLGTLRSIQRIGLTIFSSIWGGLIIAILLAPFFTVGTFEILISIVSFLGGSIIGLSSNWTPPKEKSRKSHIIYEPDDEDDFDRQIEEALKGEY
ncbi:MAG: hypothetical protein JW779_07290 [Candidatus Thorarchaeota archaeon]|nr:hypothetical protein [Candidatus Thorarchaeota archaeon]